MISFFLKCNYGADLFIIHFGDVLDEAQMPKPSGEAIFQTAIPLIMCNFKH